jgi:hypothetical protein
VKYDLMSQSLSVVAHEYPVMIEPGLLHHRPSRVAIHRWLYANTEKNQAGIRPYTWRDNVFWFSNSRDATAFALKWL